MDTISQFCEEQGEPTRLEDGYAMRVQCIVPNNQAYFQITGQRMIKSNAKLETTMIEYAKKTEDLAKPGNGTHFP